MKKLLITFFTLIIMALVTALTVPFFIPLEEYKKAALNFLQEKTGHKVTIAGDVSFALLPQVVLKLEGVRVDNPSGFTSPYLAQIGKLELEVEALPLLSKQVKISALSLTAPEIWLEEDRTGKANWTMKASAASSPESQEKASKNAPSFTYNIGKVSLDKADLHMLLKGQNIAAQDVSAEWADNQLTFRSNMQYQAAMWNVALAMQDPLAWWQGGTSALELTLQQPQAKVEFNGTLHAQPKDIANTLALKGKLNLGISSLSEFAKSIKNNAKLPDQSLVMESMNAEITKRSIAMNPVEIQYDGHQINGKLGFDWGKKNIAINGKLNLPKFDYATWKGKQAAEGGVVTASAEDVSRDWDNTPIDLSFLQQFSMQMEVALGELITESLTYEDVRMKMHNQSGNLQLDLENVNTLGGVANGKLAVSAAGSLQSQLNFQNIESEKLINMALERSRLRGAMQGEVAFASTGKSLRSWMQNLQGGGKILVPEGQVDGFSLPKLFRNILPKTGAAESTSNANIKLQFLADNGVISVQEGFLRAQELLAEVSGNIDMGNKHVDLRLRPKLAPQFNTENTEAGQAAGLLVPLKIIGRFENISVRPDAKGAVMDALQNPEKAKENIKILKREGEAVIKGLEDQKDALKDEWKDLKNNKSPEALGKLLNTLDQSGVALPKVLDVLKAPEALPAKEPENPAGSVDGGAGVGEQPNPSPIIDSGGESAGQQPPPPDQSGAPAIP